MNLNLVSSLSGGNPVENKPLDSQQDPPSTSEKTSKAAHLTMMLLNTWNQGKEIANGENILNELIKKKHPDIVCLTEIVDKDYTEKLFELLNKNLPQHEKYKDFYFSTVGELGILSRYPIKEAVSRDHFTKEDLSNVKKQGSWVVGNNVIRVTVDVDGQDLDIYEVLLDYNFYAASLPRGISDRENEEGKVETLPSRVTDINQIRDSNLKSKRPEFMKQLIEDAKERGHPTIIAGDFNEPSWRDWVEETKNSYSHNGVAYEWDTTKTLETNGFVDSYRFKYPNPVTNPGITWPVFSTEKNTTEAPVDQQERLDFIFTNSGIEIEDSSMIGPDEHNAGPDETNIAGHMVKTPQTGEYKNDTKWSSDHDGMWLGFNIPAKPMRPSN